MIKLIAVGDMHLGRRPSRLPDELQDRVRELGPAGAWERLVEAAIQEHVHAVVFAGDVVERENDFFEAYRELYQGVVRLTKAEIQVLGVSGNHDVLVLPRLADQIPDFQLLGRNGQWESVQIETDGECLTLWGWSFPQIRVIESPLSGTRFERGPGINLGLLHCDRDQAKSAYAPVTSQELESAGLDGWLLGHIHKPDKLTASSLSGYLGSITGVEPSETAMHGPWLVTIKGGRIHEVKQWELAPLIWENLEVDLTGITEAEEARVRLLESLKKLDAELSAGRWSPEAVGLRVSLVGRNRLGQKALDLLSQEEHKDIYPGESGTIYFIERLEAFVQPEIPLEKLAQRSDPAGLLARRLLLIDRPSDDPERQASLKEARAKLEKKIREARWSDLQLSPPSEEEAADWLRRAGLSLLERMLAQRELEA